MMFIKPYLVVFKKWTRFLLNGEANPNSAKSYTFMLRA